LNGTLSATSFHYISVQFILCSERVQFSLVHFVSFTLKDDSQSQWEMVNFDPHPTEKKEKSYLPVCHFIWFLKHHIAIALYYALLTVASFLFWGYFW